MTDILLCVLIALMAIGVHQLVNIRRSLTDLFVIAVEVQESVLPESKSPFR